MIVMTNGSGLWSNATAINRARLLAPGLEQRQAHLLRPAHSSSSYNQDKNPSATQATRNKRHQQIDARQPQDRVNTITFRRRNPRNSI